MMQTGLQNDMDSCLGQPRQATLKRIESRIQQGATDRLEET